MQQLVILYGVAIALVMRTCLVAIIYKKKISVG